MTLHNTGFSYKAAVDVGFHSIKAAIVWDDTIHTELVSAIVGVGETNNGLLQTGLTRPKKQQPDVVIADELRHLVGQYVNLYARPIERLDFDCLTFSPELRALLYTTLGRLFLRLGIINKDRQMIELALIVALPVQVLQGPDAKAVVQALEAWLIGTHHFNLNDQDYHLRISTLKGMAQPLGSFFDWGLNTNGQWVRSPADLKASIAVLDQGFNTLDLFHLSGGQIVRRYTGGETLGQRRAAKVMQDLLLQKGGRRFSLHEADEYVRLACNGHRAELLVKGEALDLKPLARQLLNEWLAVRPEGSGEALFIGQRGERVGVRSVQRAVERAATAADLQNVSPHTLRHSFAKALLDEGVTLEKVAALLGHNSLNTTRIYTTPGERDLEEAVAKLEDQG